MRSTLQIYIRSVVLKPWSRKRKDRWKWTANRDTNSDQINRDSHSLQNRLPGNTTYLFFFFFFHNLWPSYLQTLTEFTELRHKKDQSIKCSHYGYTSHSFPSSKSESTCTTNLFLLEFVQVHEGIRRKGNQIVLKKERWAQIPHAHKFYTTPMNLTNHAVK